ncbi:PEP/pyruvate-binding domain-containing protein [Kribbella kalugense]|uniref:Pyruvate,water dikinase n=1 Tax=Kribbella kalugense TaxID=2512221 RepID=A0A4R7ZF10_9ACTN|nr:PEP/pyruvate-binding domain-containing protein [Kribbella kalugense]TDW14841.1 pyruvate,water dikinase [Kribbella kalugense]
MLVPLAAATADLCGGKAAALGALIRANLPVPEGVVVPFPTHDAHPLLARRVARGEHRPPKVLTEDLSRLESVELTEELGRWLDSVGDPVVAVRSSAANEDTASASAAGQHDSFLGVQGVAAVEAAVRACWASLWSDRATAYRDASGGDASMAVIVQRQVDSEVSGVMFTPADATGTTVIEASWGLGPSVVEGRVTPDRYWVTADGSVTRTIADKPTSLDRHGSHAVPTSRRTQATLTDATATRLAQLGQEVTAVLGNAQDIEWALTADHLWLLQSRPITAQPPTASPSSAGQPAASSLRSGVPASVGQAAASGLRSGVPGSAGQPVVGGLRGRVLTGAPASHGTASGPVRIVLGPADFGRVRPGDILVCRFTDPAWTPLLGIAAGVITETGGILSHAAIVARERGIPAIVAVPNATTDLPNDTPITMNGSTGTIHRPEG